MPNTLTRRNLIASAVATGALMALPGVANANPVKLRFADSTTADAPRSRALQEIFAREIGEDFKFEGYFSGTLYRQGTEIVAVQRGNLEMALMPPSDFAEQVPEFSILTAAYLVRDAAHMTAIFNSDVGAEFKRLAREKMGVHILTPAYYGTRNINLRGDREINTPQDMAGVKLRMPGGEAWQFLGEAIGANPTPVAYSEVYTALQTGAIDAEDNPLSNNRIMKFYEVTDQIVLTRHNVGFGLLLINAKLFDGLSGEQQKLIQDAADNAFAWSNAEYLKEEDELIGFFKEKGIKVHEPDINAFRSYANEKYAGSRFSNSWPDGMLEKINAL